jgi:hypothetical protein
MSNIGELYQFINGKYCKQFLEGLTQSNKPLIIDKMMNDEIFVKETKLLLDDDAKIREILNTKMEKMLKQQNSKKVSENSIIDELYDVTFQKEEHCIEEKIDERGCHIGSDIYLHIGEDNIFTMITPNFVIRY